MTGNVEKVRDMLANLERSLKHLRSHDAKEARRLLHEAQVKMDIASDHMDSIERRSHRCVACTPDLTLVCERTPDHRGKHLAYRFSTGEKVEW